MCFFSHQSGLSGAERAMLELIEDLVADHGAVCSVVMPGEGPQIEALERIGAASIVAQPYGWWCTDGDLDVSAADKDGSIVENVKVLAATAMSALRQLDPDVVWTQTIVIPWGAVAAAELRKPHVWWVTEFGEDDFGFKFFSPLSQVAAEVIESSDLVFAVSKIVADTVFAEEHRDRVQILHCDVRVPSTVASDGQPGLFRVPGAARLGVFSQVRPSKGQEDAVRALARLSSGGRNVELLIAGWQDAAYTRKLGELAVALGIEGRVNMVGPLADWFPPLQACDIVIVPSRMEAFGRVGVEAMLLGKPVVFTATGGLSEYMTDGRTGLSYSPGDVEGLAVRLQQLLDDPDQRHSMGRNGRAQALEIFSKENFSGRVYRELQGLRARGRRATAMPKSIERLVQAGAAPDPSRLSSAYVGRNDPCPCGSGKRFKQCHGRLS